MKPNFSVVLIARNESKTLPLLVGSLKEFRARGGEIVLVDTGSKDDTAELARGLGCKVEEVGDRFRRNIDEDLARQINEKFCVDGEGPVVSGGDSLFDYAAARNYAASLASNDMVAMPDCDEVYTKLDLDTICAAIDSGVAQLEYNFVFAHDENGGELVKFMHSKFYDRRKMKWVGIIHEVLQGDGERKFFDESVIKLEHWQNVETNRSGYLKGLALSVVNEPDNDRNAHYFGRELLYTGRPKSAIKMLQKHVDMNRWPEERSQSFVHMGEAYLFIGDERAAVHAWIDAFDAAPNRREPLMKLAEYYYRKDSAPHVIAYVAAALQIKPGNFYANFQPYYEHLPHELMYWALWKLGEYNASKRHFDICVGYQPFNPKYLNDMRWYFKLPVMSIIVPTMRSEGLERLKRSIESLNYPQDRIETIVLEDSPRIGVPKRLKEGVEKATGDWIVYAADDIELHPDSLISALKQAWDNGKLFMAFNGGPVGEDQGNICEHFMIHKDMVKKLGGEVFDTEFNHVGVDNLLWAKMKRLGHAMRCERAKFTHHHFSHGAEMDDVYRLAWNEESVKKDRELLERKLRELNG